MASIFLRGSTKFWICSYKAWDAAKGKWRWVQQSTGVTDKVAAGGIAKTLQNGAQVAGSGGMTKGKAVQMVNDILKLAGLETIEAAPTLAAFVETLTKERDVSEGTAKKYRGQWSSLREWAGAKADLPLDGWNSSMVSDYYAHVREKHSATTANDHLRFVGMVFSRAVALGHIQANPADAIVRVGNDSVEKETISRSETVRLLKTIRRTQPRPLAWVALCALGWHTGHRIQDLLNIDAEKDVTLHDELGYLIELRPAKKARQTKARIVVLPLPTWLGRLLKRIGGFTSIRQGSNHNGRISGDFITWLKAAGIDPMPVQRKNRIVHLKSFHSNRHGMASRLIGAGVSGELSRLVTDHASAKVQARYVHPEIKALKAALVLARRV
jgi:site-specific recombinase XerD